MLESIQFCSCCGLAMESLLQNLALRWAHSTGQPAPLHTIKVLKQLRHLAAPLLLQQLVYLFTAGTTYDFTQEIVFFWAWSGAMETPRPPWGCILRILNQVVLAFRCVFGRLACI